MLFDRHQDAWPPHPMHKQNPNLTNREGYCSSLILPIDHETFTRSTTDSPKDFDMANGILAREQNIEEFNADVAAHEGYIYTAIDRWSSRYATGRQSEELVKLIAANFTSQIKIVDIGCGDGTYTREIANRFRPQSMRALDPASNAVRIATERTATAPAATPISFEVGNIYELENKGEELAVVRGVLHHLDRPKEAVAELCRCFDSILVLEPNGYNPVLKVIEKVSPYHRRHGEKSYWPPTLNTWFADAGFEVVTQSFFLLVPYFCPTGAAKLLASLEGLSESIPVVRHVSSGTNLVLYRRRK